MTPFSLPPRNGSVTHTDCNEYQSRGNKEKSKNISTYYIAVLLREVKRPKIDIDRRHIDLNSTEGVTNWHILKISVFVVDLSISSSE